MIGVVNWIAAAFAMIAAILWFYSTLAKVAADPHSNDFQIIEDGIDVLETAKLQVRWNRWAAAAASIAAAAQAIAAAASA